MNYCQNEGPEGVNYAGFLYHVIPELALAKEMDEEVLTDRLSHHHMPSPAVEKKISFKRLNSPAKPQSVKRGAPKTLDETIADEKEEDVANGTEKELGLHLVSHHIREVVQQANEGLDMDATVKKQAAVRIQSKFRCRIAKRKAAHLKLVICFIHFLISGRLLTPLVLFVQTDEKRQTPRKYYIVSEIKAQN